jgi:hypothetical protein
MVLVAAAKAEDFWKPYSPPCVEREFVAAQILGVYGPLSRVAVPDLLPMLKGTQYERNRTTAAKALGPKAAEAVPYIKRF